MDKSISLIVCCYNSAQRISKTLHYILEQKIPSFISIEVVIVNNNCTDNTIDIVRDVWNESCTKFKLVLVNEINPGLIHARRKGIAAASNEIVIFCDDDNWLQEDYLSISYELMSSDSFIGGIGGQGIAVSDESFPDWFEKVQNSYACGKQLPFSGDASQRGYLWGAGLVSRKSILEQVFDLDYPFLCQGRKGDILLAGDDSEICHRLIILGYRLIYNENLVYSHFISRNRLSLEYYNKMILGFQLSERYHLIYKRFFFKLFLKVDNDLVFFSKIVFNFFYIKLLGKSSSDFLTFNFSSFLFHWIRDSNYRRKVNLIRRFFTKYQSLGSV
jgi:glycosyltransferase involved in cell wall biosynthesis